MDPNLDPSIRRQLTAFRSRWRVLLFGRGLCITLLVLLAGLLLLMVTDGGLSLNQAERVWASGAVYGVVLVVLIVACIWRPRRLPDERGLATLMEKADPDLREDLLSAVELSNVEAGEGHDSARFRELLREDVAARMAKVYVPDILPMGLIKRWLTFALVLLGVMAIVSLVPASRNRLLRVAMPWWANIGNVASSHIVLLDPAGHDNITAPLDEKLPVRIEINGIDLHENPYLETDDGEGNVRKMVMNNDPDGNATMRFVSSVKMEAPQMRFRFHAGKHETRWFTAIAQEPPVITAFTKEYIYPDYTGLPSKVHEKEGGEISVLQGSRVDLTIHLDQPVKSAKLQVEFPNATNILDLLPANAGDLLERSARFTVSTNGVYLVELIAANGRPNREADQYPIEAIPDEPPEIVIDSPEGDIARRPEDVVLIKATASDDVGLKAVKYLARLEGPGRTNAWTTNVLVLPNLPDTNATIEAPLDLLKLDARPGDRVITRLAAIDLKDQTNMTGRLTIAVHSAVFEIARADALEPKRDIFEAVTKLRGAVTQLRAAVPGNLEQKARDGALGVLRRAGDAFDEAQPKLTSSMADVEQAIRKAITKARPGREAAELVLFGQTVARLRHDWNGALRRHLPALPNDPADLRIQRAKLAADAVGKMDKVADLLVKAARDHLAADEAAVLLDHVDYLGHAQRLMNRVAKADEADDPDTWKRLARRESAAIREVLVVEQLLTNAAPRFADNIAENFRTARADLQAAREALKPVAEADPPDRALLIPSQSMQAQIEQVAQMMRPVARNQFDAAAKSRDELELAVGEVAVPVRQLRDAVSALVAKENPFNQDRVAQMWTAVIEQLLARTALEGGRPDSDHLYLKDLTDAAGALENLQEIDDPPADQIKTLVGIHEALEALELAHRLTGLELSLKSLSQRERWEQRATDVNTLRAREWDWQRGLLRRLPPDMRRVGLAAISAEIIENADGSAESRGVTIEFNKRKDKGGIFGVENTSK
jgi:hypothetical protein